MAESNAIDSELSDILATNLDFANDFPFLTDDKTISFFKNSKILIINRGLPGSGKSTLSKKIANLYGLENTVICAGDDYFTDELGNYKYNKDKLDEVHEAARQKAIKACKDGKSPVISDNTNLTLWECKKYLNVARDFNYIPLIVEPRTSHKFNPDILVNTNKHNVSKETIIRKLNTYEILIPYYFGWFLNTTSSNELVNTAKKMFDECVNKCNEFNKTLKIQAGIENLNELFEFKFDTKLHCTSKFYGKKRVKDDYLKNPLVSLSNGKVFTLKITGFTITKQTIAAIVELNPTSDNKVLWNNDLDENKLNELLDDPFFRVLNKTKRNKFLGLLKFSERAHITIGIIKGGSNSQSGIDCIALKLRDYLNEASKKPSNKLLLEQQYDLIGVDTGYYLIKLKEPLYYDAIFSADY